ncbi:MAG: hypothetical protein JSR43_02380 [Proteobacteria bacterium]|nr:hypothetical protein [Pseudomonadota bacterium]
MTQPSTTSHNPFMLLLDPAAVLAAVEKSERLNGLNRHLCRPLDRPTPTTTRSGEEAEETEETEEPEETAACDFVDAAQAADAAAESLDGERTAHELPLGLWGASPTTLRW